MRTTIIVLVGGLLVTAICIGAFFYAFMPIISPRQGYAAEIDLNCPASAKPVARLILIPDPITIMEPFDFDNVAIDHRADCTRLVVKVHDSVLVHILNEAMVAPDVKLPASPAPAGKGVKLIEPTGKISKNVDVYDINLEQLRRGEWVGLSSIAAGQRTSFDTYDHEPSFQLSSGSWQVEFVGHTGMHVLAGNGQLTWDVKPSDALRRVYQIGYSVKHDEFSGARELALMLISIGVGIGLTTTFGALWRLIVRKETA
jgi:hypothetical protein